MGVVRGVLILWAYFTSTFYLMKWIFGLEAVAPIDTLLNHDDDKNVANIVSKNSIFNTFRRCNIGEI